MALNTCVHTTEPTMTPADYRCALAGLRGRKRLNNHSPVAAISLTHYVRKVCLGTTLTSNGIRQ